MMMTSTIPLVTTTVSTHLHVYAECKDTNSLKCHTNLIPIQIKVMG